MNSFFRSGLVAVFATASLAAAAVAADRVATVDRSALKKTLSANSSVSEAKGGAPPSDCEAQRRAATAATSRDTRIAQMDLESAAPTGGRSADVEVEGRDGIIPAIYTWKPEMRFVFYRNVGKWM